MTDQEQHEDNFRDDRPEVVERIIERDSGVHPGIAIFLCVMMLFCIVGTTYTLNHKNAKTDAACDQSNAAIQAQAQAEKAKAEFGAAIQSRIDKIQMEVAGMCVANHGVPVFINGNVDCKR